MEFSPQISAAVILAPDPMSALNQKLIDWLQIDQSPPFSGLGPAAARWPFQMKQRRGSMRLDFVGDITISKSTGVSRGWFVRHAEHLYILSPLSLFIFSKPLIVCDPHVNCWFSAPYIYLVPRYYALVLCCCYLNRGLS